jgi:small neutral amino acid transporter SnatA (MarC family)
MDLFSAIVTLFLVMDPLGNVPVFLSVLRTVSPERRRAVLFREIAIAYAVLLAFFLMGEYLLQFLALEQEAVSIAGGIVLFLIALRMIFPGEGGRVADPLEGEPFVVPLAIPLIAGPSALATLLLLQRSWAIHVPSSCSARARPHRDGAPDGNVAGHGVGADADQRSKDVPATAIVSKDAGGRCASGLARS